MSANKVAGRSTGFGGKVEKVVVYIHLVRRVVVLQQFLIFRVIDSSAFRVVVAVGVVVVTAFHHFFIGALIAFCQRNAHFSQNWLLTHTLIAE